MQPQPTVSDTNWLTRPISRREGRLLFLATLTILIDCITTLTFQLTKIGTENNPILRMLLKINPLLVYPFLLSTLVAFFIFRFSQVIQTSITLFMVSIHTLASINNIGLILFRDSFIINYFKDKPDYLFNAQQLSFLIGLTYIGAYTAYDALARRTQIRSSIKQNVTYFAIYLVAYFFINSIPLFWTMFITK